MQFPEPDGPLDPEWFRPLFDFFPSVPAVGSLKYFDPDDFMVMGRILRGPRPDLTLYKHRYTRRYLNLDGASHPYRYFPPAEGRAGSGQYRPHKRLEDSLWCLGLWELPQLKPMLGRVLADDPPLDADELDEDRIGDDAGEEGRRGGLRLV